jgi:hypothetical protein
VIDANDPHCTWGDIVRYVVWAKNNNEGPWVNLFTGLEDASGWGPVGVLSNGSGIITGVRESDDMFHIIAPKSYLNAGTYELSWETNDLTAPDA